VAGLQCYCVATGVAWHISMVDASYVLSVIDWPEASDSPDLSLASFFERRAATDPNSCAVRSETSQLSYFELNCAANAVADAILSRGTNIGDRIAILMRHDVPLVVATLATLKVGGVAVVLNPGEPEARHKQLIADADAKLVLSDEADELLASDLAEGGTVVFNAEAAMRNGSPRNPGIVVRPDHLAFLIYTSGSTGEPKGVMRTHHQALHNATRMSRSIGTRADDRLVQVFAMSTEVGMTLTWAALLNGASLYPYSLAEQGLPGFPAWIQAHAVTVLSLTTTVFRQIVKSFDKDTRLESVRVLRFGSEEATSEDFAHFRRHFPGQAILLHSFGSSEAGIIMHRRIAHSEILPEGPIAVGTPAYGIEIALVNEQGAEVEQGQIGEIILRSTSLSDGYWRNPQATAERFCDWPAGSRRRALRTGDLAKIDANGLLQFAGRKDSQIKLGGIRIELSGVEQAFTRVQGVERAAVILESSDGRDTLIAFVVLRPGQVYTARALRRELGRVLPRAIVPSHFVFVSELPIAPSGKVDRPKLRQLQPPRSLGRTAPQTDTEILLAKFWAETLELPGISRDDDYFELGGDSLQATAIAAHVFEALSVEIHMGTFTNHPTLAEFAVAVDEMRRSGPAHVLPPLIRDARDNGLPLSNYQQNAWRGSQTASGLAAAMSTSVRQIAGHLDRERLQGCLRILFERHEMLRTSFPVTDGQSVQFIHPIETVDLPFTDLVGIADPDAEAARIVDRYTLLAVDLANGPLIRFHLIRLREDRHWLMWRCHHILTDPWSWDIFMRELDVLYRTKGSSQDEHPLAKLPLRYGDFAAWQRRVIERGTQPFESMIDWWQAALSGAPTKSNLPKRPRPVADVDPKDGRVSWRIDLTTLQQLDELALREHATFFIVRLAAAIPVLAAALHQKDVVLGTYLTYRDKLALQNIFGPFIYLLPIRFRNEPNRTFRQWVSDVNRTMVGFERHGAIPFETIYEELGRRGVRLPAMQMIFNVAQQSSRHRLGDLELTPSSGRSPGMQTGFHMQFNQVTRNTCTVYFDARIFDPAKIRPIVECYRAFLERAARQPDLTVNELLAMCGAPRKRALWRWGWRR
jgi:amino acid adenylation domain-containing protein